MHVERVRPGRNTKEDTYVMNTNTYAEQSSAEQRGDNVSGLKFPVSPSCATTLRPAWLPLLPPCSCSSSRSCLKLAKLSPLLLQVCVGVGAHWCCPRRSMCSRRDASGSSSSTVAFLGRTACCKLLLLLQVVVAATSAVCLIFMQHA